MHLITHKSRRRRLEELNLLDDFLFRAAVADEEGGEEFCRILLSTILGREIRKVKVIPQKEVVGIDTNKHGICMDAYIEDISEEAAIPGQKGENLRRVDAKVRPDIYDIEPDKIHEKDMLPKRMRYYHGMIDTQFLEAGAGYEELPDVAIITILPYDPFGKDRMVYTIKNRCLEDADMEYEDGARKIFLYTRGTADHPSQKLRDMLRYMEDTTDDNVTNQEIASVQRIVTRIRHKRPAMGSQ